MKNSPSAKAKEILNMRFGFNNFREGQKSIIGHLIACRNIICVMPENSGKSLCYQLNSLLSDNLILVISTSEKKVQKNIKFLKANDIPAKYIKSPDCLNKLDPGKMKILYLNHILVNNNNIIKNLKLLTFSEIVIDDVSEVLSLENCCTLIDNLCRPPVLILSKSATDEDRKLFIDKLGLENAIEVVSGFVKSYLRYSVLPVKNESNKISVCIKIIESIKGSKIIYAETSKEADFVTERLKNSGIKVFPFYSEEHNIEKFYKNDSDILVTTNNFYKTINKENIRAIIHFSLPENIGMYYNQSAKAGLDNNISHCVILLSKQNIKSREKNIVKKTSDKKDNNIVKIEFQKLLQYCNFKGCRRNFIINHFGEPVQNVCNICDNCTQEDTFGIDPKELRKSMPDSKISEEEKTTESFSKPPILVTALKAIQEVNGKFGLGTVASILSGSKSEKMKRLKVQEYRHYSALSFCSQKTVKDLLEKAVRNGFAKKEQTESGLPILSITDEGINKIAQEISSIHIANRPYKSESFKKEVKNICDKIAKEHKLPIYRVITNNAIKEISESEIFTIDQLKNIDGINPKFIDLIHNELQIKLESSVKIEDDHNLSLKQIIEKLLKEPQKQLKLLKLMLKLNSEADIYLSLSKTYFEKQDIKHKISLIDIIGSTKLDMLLPFLRALADSENSEIRSASIKAINKYPKYKIKDIL